MRDNYVMKLSSTMLLKGWKMQRFYGVASCDCKWGYVVIDLMHLFFVTFFSFMDFSLSFG